MRSLKVRLFGAVAVAALAGFAVAAEPILSADLSGKVVEADAAHLNKLVELAKAKKKVGGKVKTTAVLLALYAEDSLGGKDGAKMTALRDEALKIAAKAKTVTEVEKEVAGLSKVAPAATVGKSMGIKKIIETTKLDLGEVMDVFGGATGGGMNLEKDIQEIKKTGVKNTAAVELIGARTALLADLTLELPNEKASGAMKKDWDNYSKDMKKLALDAAAEAAKGTKADLAKIKATVGKLDAACTNCHNKFRAD